MTDLAAETPNSGERPDSIAGLTPGEIAIFEEGGDQALQLFWTYYSALEENIIQQLKSKGRFGKFRGAGSRPSDPEAYFDAGDGGTSTELEQLAGQVMDRLGEEAVKGGLVNALQPGTSSDPIKVIWNPFLLHRLSDHLKTVRYRKSSTTIRIGSVGEDGDGNRTRDLDPESRSQHSLEEISGRVPLEDRKFSFPFSESNCSTREERIFTAMQWERIDWADPSERDGIIAVLARWFGIPIGEVAPRLQEAHRIEKERRQQLQNQYSEENKQLEESGSNALKAYDNLSEKQHRLAVEGLLCPLSKNALGALFAETPKNNTLDRYMSEYKKLIQKDDFLNNLFRQDSDQDSLFQ